ncbi:PrgI family protein [Actinorugispora endophytica]|uniref:PrgI family protein n=1 Tax=Actinorugispora endophytica TaxID=1605990 RepID=A0A4R6V695_9ACTN|nr:PrgI family protein [Actinorugispora endophytica]TDQ54385.1 PrgI family protein [Actinorugispora endophytica]
MSDFSRWRARIPADIDRPDPLLGPLTGRQLLILAPAALGVWLLFLALGETAPLWAAATVATVLAGTATALAVGQRDGIGLDAFAAAALAWTAAPKHRVGAPDGIPPLPRWAPRRHRGPALEPLRLPASAIHPDGVIDLDERCAALIACTTVNFHLAAPGDQDAAVGAFAAVLDALTTPVQILVQGRAVDLSPYTSGLREGAAELPHPALEDAAHAHADFLDALQAERDLIERVVLVAVTAPGTAAKARRAVLRRAEDTAAHLAAIGIRARICDGTAAERLLRASLAPAFPPAPDNEE